MTTGEAEINAAASTTALFFSSLFDFTKTYFLIAGIGGGNPYRVTTGSAVYARFAIQSALREAPSNWTTGYWAFGTSASFQYPGYNNWYGTEIFELKHQSIGAGDGPREGHDTAQAAAYRAQWDLPLPTHLPQSFNVMSRRRMFGSPASFSETPWKTSRVVGRMVPQSTARVPRKTTRPSVNFDRAPPGLTTYQAIEENEQGFEIGLQNFLMASWPVVKEVLFVSGPQRPDTDDTSQIVYDWKNWEIGTPPPINDTSYGDVFGILRTNGTGTLSHGVGTDLNTTESNLSRRS
ncbi:NUP-domain-containing protein [Dacryopinax primogenitus]|uniref:NUP-domain-containing protein n=1 Tax=Dacryopinax primogenitus (strain DJM 731) TaxID=1858805 RepID=M5FSC8_DACPD|nr:NUP-domain-containing protein [Dacryopinax primogenitus]EJU00311.1 NUP-domain-containing protein [Dacryopinax primogenitus]